MNKTDDDHSYLSDSNYLELERHYKDYPIALYTGAGVSWSRDKKFGLHGWNDFVKRVLLADERTNTATPGEFEQSVNLQWADEPWEIAEWVVQKTNSQAGRSVRFQCRRFEPNPRLPHPWLCPFSTQIP